MTNTLTIYYASGLSVSDFVLEEFYQYVLAKLQQDNVTLTCSNETLFLRVRVGIVKGEIAHENVRFRWRGLEFAPDENGRIDNWPDGFLDMTDRLLEELLGYETPE